MSVDESRCKSLKPAVISVRPSVRPLLIDTPQIDTKINLNFLLAKTRRGWWWGWFVCFYFSFTFYFGLNQFSVCMSFCRPAAWPTTITRTTEGFFFFFRCEWTAFQGRYPQYTRRFSFLCRRRFRWQMPNIFTAPYFRCCGYSLSKFVNDCLGLFDRDQTKLTKYSIQNNLAMRKRKQSVKNATNTHTYIWVYLVDIVIDINVRKRRRRITLAVHGGLQGILKEMTITSLPCNFMVLIIQF